jgi:hypothetical protein
MGDNERQGFEGWAILELMGHRRIAGRVSEATIGGGSFIRIDVPADEDRPGATQFYAPGAVYAITPTTEDVARRVACRSRPEPVQEWELPKQLPPSQQTVEVDVDDLGDPDDDRVVGSDEDGEEF